MKELKYEHQNSYNVIFHFMNIHPLNISKVHSVTIHIVWMAHGVGGGWWVVGGDGMVGGFMGWVSGWWGGWLESYGVGGCVVVGWMVGGFM